jgi:hypothetical protein
LKSSLVLPYKIKEDEMGGAHTKLPPLILKGKNMTIDKIPHRILSVLTMKNL